MFLTSWLPARGPRRSTARRPALHLELLEAREVPAVAFGKSLLAGAGPVHPTSLQFGPDGRLYVAQQSGEIDVYTIARTAANAYSVTKTEVINLVRDIPNHDDNGALNPAVVGRQVTGILVAGTAASPVVYVTSSDPRIGGGDAGTNTNLDTNSGILSRLTWNGTGWAKLDLVRGLPRSEENHSSNGLALDPATNTLYIAQGGHTNMGAPSNNFAGLPEYALSAAILKVDLTAIGNTTFDLPTLDDEDRISTADANDPFGGNNGKNQAVITATSPVQVYSPGYRNPYDLVLTHDGRLFTFDNGSNAGWGDVPLDPKGQPTTAATAGTATNALHEGGVSYPDQLTRVLAGFYAGHPNPTRANRSNTFDPTNPQSPVPAANAVEGYYKVPGVADGALATVPASTNGITEYAATNFGGEMYGDLLAAAFDNTIYRFKLNAAGDAVVGQWALFSNVGITPLDVTTITSGPLAGTIWVADYSANTIIVFEPGDLGGGTVAGTGEDDPTLDDDGDHYSNRDELANGTSPLSAADAPPDADGDFASDKADADDDNDGRPDLTDPFARDAANGRGTQLPVLYPWDNATPYPGGLLNLGFTGLMTNGKTDYLQQFDITKLTAGGAAGALTIDAVTAGTAKGAANTQDNGFQFGINATATTPAFTVHTKVKNPFAGTTPQAGQQIGLQFGTGDQDNYVELAIDGDGTVKLMREVNGSWVAVASTAVTLSGASDIDLYLTIDPAAGTATGRFTVTSNGVTGAATAVGTTTVPAGWLTAATAPAVGLMTTTGGKPTFSATYDLIEVVYAWVTGPALPVPLGEVAGGVINGKLYLVGEGNAGTYAYDLAANTWSGPLATRPFVGDHHAAEVINGKLYLFGGLGGGSDGKVQIYDPATNTWSLGAAMPYAAGSVSTALIGGTVYAAGGIVGTATTAQAAKYNPATNTWAVIASMPQGLNHSAAGTDGTKFYIFGGRDGANVVTNGYNTVEIYDPATNTWVSSRDSGSTIPPLPVGRGGMGKAVYANGEFYVIGGETLTGPGATAAHVYNRVDVYNPVAKTWRAAAPLPTARHGIFPLLGTTAAGGTRIYVAGGGTQSADSQSAVLETLLLTPPAAPAPTLPAAPTGLTAKTSLPTRVVLTWQDNAANETGYRIERKTGAGSYALLATVGAGVVSFTDATATAGTAYTYRVAATNAAGTSAYTNEAAATAPAPTNTPVGGTPWAVGATIQAEDFDYGGEVVGYHDVTAANEGGMYRATAVDIEPTADTGGGVNVGYALAGEWLTWTVAVPAAGTYTLELRVASAGAGATFHVEFGGVNKTGTVTMPNTGAWQTWQTVSVPVQLAAGTQTVRFVFDAVSPTTSYAGNLNWLRLTSTGGGGGTGGTGLPAAPSGLTATDTGTAVNLAWADNSTNETGFLIERATGTGSFAALATVAAGVTSYTDATALASATYTYRVTATSATGNSAPSSTATVTTAPAAITVNDVTKAEGNGKGTTAFTFTVTLSRASAVPVTVSYTTTDGTAVAGRDYKAASGTLTLAPGTTSQTVTVQVNRNKVAQPTRVFYLDLFNAVNGVLKTARGTGTILDDDR